MPRVGVNLVVSVWEIGNRGIYLTQHITKIEFNLFRYQLDKYDQYQ